MFIANKLRSIETAAAAPGGVWLALQPTARLRGTVTLPGSKSLTNRELILAALADGPSTLSGVLRSRDTDLMIAALEALGVKISKLTTKDTLNYKLAITPPAELTGPATIDCGLAGTVMRFMPAVATLATGPVAFDGDHYARKRPMRPVLAALVDLGADIASDGRHALPFTVHGRGALEGGRVRLNASQSSQFVSGLLLAAARFKQGMHIMHTGDKLPSLPHIEMTLAALTARGVTTAAEHPGEWRVQPGTIAARDLTIEPDLSNAAPFLAAALVTGGTVRIHNWPATTTQIGDRLRELLPLFGAAVKLSQGTLTVSGTGKIKGVKLHLPDAGELAPNLIGLAALADEPSEITGIGHIRHHETDRISALVAEINALDGKAQELSDGIKITPARLNPGVWRSYADHRMATTGALIGLAVPGVEIDDIGCVSKTMPDFVRMWGQLLRGEQLASAATAVTSAATLLLPENALTSIPMPDTDCDR
ncbi:3-phosphoshikimate 1-carboxyvinyltransferase [Canibacter sp. lx-45]|uniref:3-phosphoshikimate 1-carboxyvinyltransferase n=1 Tax=Canibacter zhuwentaonis TaxID=2837491 RepID=UPI001BDD9D8D|nr:3-phosphoshikimate 1-carboxyvinyltransferase [Canibacter zhuwentaonis]MBT1034752.1 3-phosphoshikimate 1-carboxyvinyltransferase [Canibacter zhuwentaonis]